MTSTTWMIGLLALMLSWTAACGGTSAEPEDGPDGQVQIEDFQYTRVPGGARFVTGKLYNPSAALIKNAQIQISLYDGDNRLIATMSVLVRDVAPGEHKPFRKPVDGDQAILGARVRSVLVM